LIFLRRSTEVPNLWSATKHMHSQPACKRDYF
jgi:hypothetical protein